MIPGTVSKLSESAIPVAATIRPKTDIVIITGGAGSITNIIPPLGKNFPTVLFLVAGNGAITLATGGTTGPIAVGLVVAVSRMVPLVWCKSANAWAIGM